MCGRYGLRLSPREVIESLGESRIRGPFRPRYNIAPTQPVLVMLDDGRRVEEVRWGLVPSWAEGPESFKANTFNARIETIATAPAFRDSLRAKRCIIFADGWYEWQRRGGHTTPFWIYRPGDAAFAFAGLWAVWRSPTTDEELISCTIVTQPAVDALASIHERMPAVLSAVAAKKWLNQGERDAARLLPVLAPAATGWTMHPVGSRVNAVRNDSPDLIDPVEPPTQGELRLDS